MLTQKQMNMAQIWVDNPNISMEELKDRAGVSQKTCYMYRQNEEFQEYVHQLCAQKFKDMEKVAMKKLSEEVDNNNWKAIEYVLNGLGYKGKDEMDIDLRANITIDYGE